MKPQTPPWLAAFLSGRCECAASALAVARDGAPDVVVLRHCREWGLSPRRAEVVRLAVDGLRGEEIARAMGITKLTLKTHVHAILSRAGCVDMREVVERILRAQGGL